MTPAYDIVAATVAATMAGNEFAVAAFIHPQLNRHDPVFTITMLVPINNRIARMNPEQPHPTWLQDRSRWDRLHRIRVALLVVAVILLLTGLLQTASQT